MTIKNVQTTFAFRKVFGVLSDPFKTNLKSKISLIWEYITKKGRCVMNEYVVSIADVAELTEEVLKVQFDSVIPRDAEARSSNIAATLTITGRVAYDADKAFMKDSLKAIAGWAIKKPADGDTYKAVSVTYNHTGSTRVYELSNAFVVSFHEEFADQNGTFELVVRQKTDRIDGVKVE